MTNFKNKTYLVFVVSICLLCSNCNSVAKYNQAISENLTEKQQLEDINYLQKYIYKYQPALDLYISKTELNQKFDSLRLLAKIPKKSNELYLEIAPVVFAIKQGHNVVFPVSKKLSRKETKQKIKQGKSPYNQFDFTFENDKLYILNNFSKDTLIPKGSEIIKIEELTPLQIKEKYWKTIVSDGFNITNYNYNFARRFSMYAITEMGIKDSLKYQFKHKDSIFERVIYRPNLKKEIKKPKDSLKAVAIKKNDNKEKKIKAKAESAKKRLLGYDSERKLYNKELTFKTKDSSVAVLKIRNFSTGNFKDFYKSTFELLQKKQTQTLILDLRNNPGGRLNEIKNLFSYFTNQPYQLIEPVILSKRTSLWQTPFFKSAPIYLYPLLLPAFPVLKTAEYIRPKKNSNGTYDYHLSASKINNPSPYNFSGKTYVLINGGSFSASCILSAQLKTIKNITFVGEETGGGSNQTNAGRMPMYELPNSKLLFNVLLMDIRPQNKSKEFGRGIMPDVEIKNTIEDLLNQKDSQMEWIENKLGIK